jgi:glycosyltransferase involved in cell wall biosynthesis
MKISIITATYNCDSTINNCLVSVAQQSYKKIEHIVIDGGSTDKTLEILSKHQSQIAHVLSEKDQGIYDALNKGILRASGDIIAVLHSDDVFEDINVIADVVEIFNKNSNIPMVIGNVVYVSQDNGRVLRLYASKKFRVWMLRFGFIPAHTATFVRRDVYQKIGLYSTKYISAGDFEFFVRAFWLHRLPYLVVNQVLIRMRIGGLSSSGLGSYMRSSMEILSALRENKIHSNFIFVLLRLPIKKINQLIFLFRNTNFFKN